MTQRRQKGTQKNPKICWTTCIASATPPTSNEINAWRRTAKNTVNRVDMQHVYLIIYVFATWLACTAKFFHDAYAACGPQNSNHSLYAANMIILTFGMATIMAYALCTSIENRTAIIPSAVSITLAWIFSTLILTKGFHIPTANYWHITAIGSTCATLIVTTTYSHLKSRTQQAQKILSETTEIIDSTSAKIRQWSTQSETIRTYQQIINSKNRLTVQGEYEAMQSQITYDTKNGQAQATDIARENNGTRP